MFNVARFASIFDVPDDLDTVPGKLNAEDDWILAEFQSVMNTVEEAWENIDIYTATQTLKTFATGILPSHWLEMSKSRLYDGDKSAAWTIHRIVRDLLAAFSPICPFFSHHISTSIYGTSATDIRKYPAVAKDELDGEEGVRLRNLTISIKEFNSLVWNSKKENGISLKDPIEGIEIPQNLMEFSATLTRMHSIG